MMKFWNYTLIRVSKSGNIHNRLSKLIEKLFWINHRLLIKCIFSQISACFLTTMICFLNDKKQVFVLKFYWSDVWIIIDYIKYNRSSKILNHFDQFSIIIDDRWNTNLNGTCSTGGCNNHIQCRIIYKCNKISFKFDLKPRIYTNEIFYTICR